CRERFVAEFLHLLSTILNGLGHVVEGRRQYTDLIAAGEGHTLIKTPLSDRRSAAGDLHDRLCQDVRHEKTDQNDDRRYDDGQNDNRDLSLTERAQRFLLADFGEQRAFEGGYPAIVAECR